MQERNTMYSWIPLFIVMIGGENGPLSRWRAFVAVSIDRSDEAEPLSEPNAPPESSIVTGSVGMHKVAISRNDVAGENIWCDYAQSFGCCYNIACAVGHRFQWLVERARYHRNNAFPEDPRVSISSNQATKITTVYVLLIYSYEKVG